MPRPPVRQISDVQALRALAHPARLALIDALATHGSLTATEAGELIGESPSNCSFHLRQLARFGLIEPAPPTDGRQRPWQVVAGGIGVDVDSLVDSEFSAAAAAVNEMWIARQAAAEVEWSRRMGSEPPQWREASFSELTVRWLTAAELAGIEDRLGELLAQFRERRDPALRPTDTRPVRLYFSAFPVGSRPNETGETDDA